MLAKKLDNGSQTSVCMQLKAKNLQLEQAPYLERLHPAYTEVGEAKGLLCSEEGLLGLMASHSSTLA